MTTSVCDSGGFQPAFSRRKQPSFSGCYCREIAFLFLNPFCGLRLTEHLSFCTRNTCYTPHSVLDTVIIFVYYIFKSPRKLQKVLQTSVKANWFLSETEMRCAEKRTPLKGNSESCCLSFVPNSFVASRSWWPADYITLRKRLENMTESAKMPLCTKHHSLTSNNLNHQPSKNTQHKQKRCRAETWKDSHIEKI